MAGLNLAVFGAEGGREFDGFSGKGVASTRFGGVEGGLCVACGVA